MRIDTRTKVKGYSGEELVENGKPVSYLEIFDTALNTNTREELPTAEDKSKRYQLSLKLYKNHDVDLTLDEMVLLKDRVNKIYTSPLVCGQVTELFERKESAK
jgi:hypothetical protein